MSEHLEGAASPEEAATAVDAILTRNGLPVSTAERERLIRFYPLVRDWMEQLRMLEARYEEPVLICPAAARE